MNEFLKSSELTLNSANYLVSAKSEKPVTHSEFVAQQKKAEYVVKLADAIKDKNFESVKVDDLQAIVAKVQAEINASNVKSYVTAPVKPVSAANDELVQFALDFAAYGDEKAKTDKINEFMQGFNSISDVETVGEYFSEGLSKLSKIYTIAEILAAAKINVEKIK